MQKRTQVLFTFTFIIILISGLYVFTDWFSKVTGYFTGEGEKESLARCLIMKGTEFYGTEFCSDCEKQEETLGQYFKLISYKDCGRELQNCPNLQSIPAWYINKEIHYGLKSFEELNELSNCNDK